MDDIIETKAPGQDRCPPLAAVPRAEPVTIRLPPLGRGLAACTDVLDGARRRMPPEQYTRLTSVCEEWCEARFRALDTPAQDPDLETYVAARLLTAAAAVGLVEHATATDVAGLRRADTDLEAVCRASGRFGVLVEDLFSYRRDLFSGGPVVNAVTVLQQSEGLCLQGAVDRLCEELDAAEAALHTAHDKVLAGPLGERPDVRAFVKGMLEMTAGHLRLSATTPHYHGVRLGLDPHEGSILRLTAERTLVLSVEERAG